jgi:orotate phosphoribosyltransferase
MPVRGRSCLLVDDALSAGTAARIAIDDIQGEGGNIVGMVVLFDREEVTGDATPP